MPGHIGVYVGDGLAVECTPKWKDGVQITAVHNIGKKKGYNGRAWAKHGKLPYLAYEEEKPVEKIEEECSVNVQMLRTGCKGESVKALQTLLIGYGYSCGIWGADGDFGAGTEKAVKAYQKANNLEVDGVVGPATWAKLLGVGK
jgi:murein L,D-transpeptidase YcbB/YkuD